MEDQVKEILLNGMTIPKFIAFYSASILGAFVWYLTKTLKAISKDPKTPYKFSWKYATKGLIKLLITLLILPWVIIYFSDYGPMVLDTLFSLPEGRVLVELNTGSAFVIGLGIDIFIRKLTEGKFNKLMSNDRSNYGK